MATSKVSAKSYSLRLTKEQKNYLSALLPKGYFFQSAPEQQVKVQHHKSSTMKKFAIPKEETVEEKQPVEQKRRKAKGVVEPEVIEKRNILGKKEEINKRAQIIKKLKRHEDSWPFRNPVNPKVLDIPNYFEVILVPMDLHSIEERIKEDKYEHPSEIERDITQMFLNSYKFNPKNDNYFLTTTKLEAYYHSLLEESEELTKKELPERNKKKDETPPAAQEGTQKHNQFTQIQRQIGFMLRKTGQYCNNQKMWRQKPSYFSTKNDLNLTLKEKKELTQEIRKLDPSHLQRVFSIIKNSPHHQNHHNASNGANSQGLQVDESKMIKQSPGQQIFGVDVEKLDQRTLRELQNYVRLQKNSVMTERDRSYSDSKELKYSSK